MRKNVSEVIRSFDNGKAARPSVSISTDGHSIYSYETCLVTHDGSFYIMNVTKYSKTTSQQQNAIISDLPRLMIIKVDNMPRGCSSLDLRKAAVNVPIN